MSIVIENLSFTYMKKTPYEKKALKNLSLEIRDGEFLGIIGSTGSGKSTLIQHINGLLPCQEGKIVVSGIDLSCKKPDYKAVRKKVGVVFQYPEYQLFDETVEKDVGFGPKNMGLKEDEIKERVRESLQLVGLNVDEIGQKSPFDLSGGQKRRVAIAGVIAMRPEILVLDEPTAGLDPQGKKEILDLVKNLQKTCSPTVIMISHNMDEISDMADRIALMHKGELLACLTPDELFSRKDLVDVAGLELPVAVSVIQKLRDRGVDLGQTVCRKSELADLIARRVKKC
ncbi:MAG: energy-coupling factor transporter ATPase [Clostridia bacterium]|nr:energy-coupling factor transporter ATPase [Clostridia bacterium]